MYVQKVIEKESYEIRVYLYILMCWYNCLKIKKKIIVDKRNDSNCKSIIFSFNIMLETDQMYIK